MADEKGVFNHGKAVAMAVNKPNNIVMMIGDESPRSYIEGYANGLIYSAVIMLFATSPIPTEMLRPIMSGLVDDLFNEVRNKVFTRIKEYDLSRN